MLSLFLALLISWNIGFTVQTRHPTNVVVRWHERCSTNTAYAARKGQFEVRTPITRNLAPTLADAKHCHLRVVAWDIKPWYNQHHGQRPTVGTWAHT